MHAITPAETTAPTRLLRATAVLDRIGIKAYSTIYRWEREGKFPKRIRVGAHAIAWRESDIEAWIASREAR